MLSSLILVNILVNFKLRFPLCPYGFKEKSFPFQYDIVKLKKKKKNHSLFKNTRHLCGVVTRLKKVVMSPNINMVTLGSFNFSL